MTANERQIGGDHYAKGGEFQHWDMIVRNHIGYLEGCATKYVSRWRSKNGLQDLEKALHYVDKILEVAENHGYRPHGVVPQEELAAFCNAYELSVIEASICTCLLRWSHVNSIKSARRDIRELISFEKGEHNAR